MAAAIVGHRTKETSTTTGAGTYQLLGAGFGFVTFVAGIGTGNTCFYVATDLDPLGQTGDWEFGTGVVTDASPDTLTRATIIASSNGGAAVNWGVGTRDIYSSPDASAFMIGSNNLLELSNAATARTNLGLGDAAVRNEGTGNLLDADMVDGVHDAAFAHLAGTETISGDKTFSGANTWSGINTYTAKQNFDSGSGRIVLPVGSNLWAAT